MLNVPRSTRPEGRGIHRGGGSIWAKLVDPHLDMVVRSHIRGLDSASENEPEVFVL